MKTLVKNIFLGLVVLLLIPILYLGAQSVRLHWWVTPDEVQVNELTSGQKADDMRYLLDLTQQVSQADVVWDVAGMDNPLKQPEVWIERARQTQSNAEFADLVLQFLVHAGQTGHAFPAYDVNFNIITSLVSDAPKDAFYKMPYWGNLIGGLSWNAHANLDLVYRDGNYILNKAVTLDGIKLPIGSVVEKVDNMVTEEFVLQQQYRAHLRYDPNQEKFFIFPLLTVDPGPDQPGWDITFRLPDGGEQTVFVKKLPGYVPHRPDESRAANIRCVALDGEVLYIKIATFYYEYADQDAVDLRKCFASGSYQKVIFDVRGNNGGEIWSYMDNIMAPLIRQPVGYESTVAIKETFYNWYGWRLRLFSATNDNELSDPKTHITKVEASSYLPYSDQGWRVLRVMREIQPSAEPFPFDGQAYVLTDNNALSAGDSFAAAMQQTGLAKIVGTNTVGWGQAYQAKMLYALPNSGFLFFLDSELTFNSDGTLNNYVGVIPDVFLSPSSYPTPYPVSISLSSLLADEWVQWVLADTSKGLE